MGCSCSFAPSLRLPSLWPELVRLCQGAGLPTQISEESSETLRFARVGDHSTLGLVSWRVLIEVLLLKLSAAGETRSIEDLRQLLGLCERMDEDAFLPIRSEELSEASPQRVFQFMTLVDVLRLAAPNAGAALRDCGSANRKESTDATCF